MSSPTTSNANELEAQTLGTATLSPDLALPPKSDTDQGQPPQQPDELVEHVQLWNEDGGASHDGLDGNNTPSPDTDEGRQAPEGGSDIEHIFSKASGQQAGHEELVAKRPDPLSESDQHLNRSGSEPTTSHLAGTSEQSAKKRPISASPYLPTDTPATSKSRRLNDGSEGIRPGDSITPRDFAEVSASHEGESGSRELEETEKTGKQTETSPLAGKSEIAPWMTQRHKRAIRRSLEAQSSSSPPAKEPASSLMAGPERPSSNGSAATEAPLRAAQHDARRRSSQ